MPIAIASAEGMAILFVELGLGHAVLPRLQAQTLAKRAELAALPIRGLAPMPFGWAAREFELLPTSARDFLTLFARRQAKPSAERNQTRRGSSSHGQLSAQ